MSIAVNSITSVIDARGAGSEVTLVPGRQFSAEVIKLLPDNLVRIAIGNVTVDVQSEVPLQAGQLLQLVAMRTAEGIRLAMVGPAIDPQGGEAAVAGGAAGRAATVVASLPSILLSAASRLQLTPPEAVAVAGAAQAAVSKQAGLSQLFANLDAASGIKDLPPQLQQAIVQLLAQRLSADAPLSGEALRSAVKSSGVFLEATLASGAVQSPAVAQSSVGQGDMKAALVVFRHVLATFGNAATPPEPATAMNASRLLPGQAAITTPADIKPGTAPAAQTSVSSPTIPAAMAAAVLKMPMAPPIAPSVVAGTIVAAPNAARKAEPKVSVEALLSATGAASDDGVPLPATSLMRPSYLSSDPEGGRLPPNSAPPPVRGALPSAQPVALQSLALDASPEATARHLVEDADAAIARQTLLQIASLPERIDGAARHDAASRLNFEIPFALPQGTAVAQFEISRDRADAEKEAAKRAWRARFSLDIEPAGPVHVLISLIGDETSVRMWAERPATAQQLRDGAAQLNQALVRADLKPGDILIREGAPVQAPVAPAGHFLDRAL